MSQKWHETACPICKHGIFRHGVKQSVFEYRGKILQYEQPGAWCSQCSEGMITGSEAVAVEPLLDAFVRQTDEENARDLARIRKKLKLSRQQAAQLTGGGQNSFSGYERGEAKPLPAIINLFRLLDRHPELLKELHYGVVTT